MLPDFHRIEGLTPVEQCEHLAKLAADVPADRAIVEIGVYKGRSAVALGAGAKTGGGAHVWAVDPWDLPGVRIPWGADPKGNLRHRAMFTRTSTRIQARRNIRGRQLGDVVTLVRALSLDAARDWSGPPVGLLHIDGDHHYRAVIDDFEAWSPHLAPGAVVAFDDHAPTHPEVPQAVGELVAQDRLRLREVLFGRLAVCET